MELAVFSSRAYDPHIEVYLGKCHPSIFFADHRPRNVRSALRLIKQDYHVSLLLAETVASVRFGDIPEIARSFDRDGVGLVQPPDRQHPFEVVRPNFEHLFPLSRVSELCLRVLNSLDPEPMRFIVCILQ